MKEKSEAGSRGEGDVSLQEEEESGAHTGETGARARLPSGFLGAEKSRADQRSGGNGNDFDHVAVVAVGCDVQRKRSGPEASVDRRQSGGCCQRNGGAGPGGGCLAGVACTRGTNDQAGRNGNRGP
jgi:hypothetical protein